MSRYLPHSAIALALCLAPALGAQQSSGTIASTNTTAHADTAADENADVGQGRPGLQFGVATGGLSYPGGVTEQSLGAVLRWVPVQWLALSATPTGARLHRPATAGSPEASRTGLIDLPVEASVSHAFAGRLTPTVSAGLGMTLPVGDETTGFGSGAVGYSASLGAGFSPTESVWLHASAGRSLSDLASTYATGSGWADLSGGTSLSEKLSVGAGYSSDFGAYDVTVGRSTSLSGNVAYALRGATTFNLSASHGLGGAAPSWSLVVAIGSAFPYLNHLGAGSAMTLRNTFGGGSQGIGSGVSGGRGRGRNK